MNLGKNKSQLSVGRSFSITAGTASYTTNIEFSPVVNLYLLNLVPAFTLIDATTFTNVAGTLSLNFSLTPTSTPMVTTSQPLAPRFTIGSAFALSIPLYQFVSANSTFRAQAAINLASVPANNVSVVVGLTFIVQAQEMDEVNLSAL